MIDRHLVNLSEGSILERGLADFYCPRYFALLNEPSAQLHRIYSSLFLAAIILELKQYF